MITLRGVCKSYPTRSGRHEVLRDVDLTIRRGEKVGVLGRNGAGKSTLIRLLAGSELPTRGEVQRGMSVSWPLAFTGATQGSLTGLDNLRFICRVYGADPVAVLPFVESFSELGKFLHEPMKNYSSGMQARFAFALSMAIEFDCFLIDEVVSVGDARFHERCAEELWVKRHDRALLLVSHHPENIRAHCERACVLHGGRLHAFDSIEAAFEFHHQSAASEAFENTAG